MFNELATIQLVSWHRTLGLEVYDLSPVENVMGNTITHKLKNMKKFISRLFNS
jgi:hypothetical protein